MILEADIIQFLKGGKTFSTADIYKTLGGKKSKDVRTQLDDLYKQGVIERTKISNSYFWTLKTEEDDELLEVESDSTVAKFYNILIKQLREEIRFLRCTVTDLLNYKQSAATTNSNNTPNLASIPSSAYNIFPTETPVIHTTTSPSQPPPPPPPPPIQSRIAIPTITSSAQFETPKRSAPHPSSAPFVIPLSNRYEPLQNAERSHVTVTTSQPTISSMPVSSTHIAQIHQVSTENRTRNNPLPLSNNIGPHVNRHPEHDILSSTQRNNRNKQNPATQKNKVGLLGDSNLNRIIVPEMNSCLKRATVAKFSYSGATSVHLRHYCDVLLEEKPDSILIHGGTNDIWGKNQRKNATLRKIAEDIISIGLKCRERGVKNIYISSIIITRNSHINKNSRDINEFLKLLCVQYNFFFIDNSFITQSDLNDDDEVHLSWEGRKKLVNNFINILDS